METTNRKLAAFYDKAAKIIHKDRLFTDYTRRLAWGTDAGFYRKIPQVVVFPQNEQEVSVLLREASRQQLPITFRAAGTSLSGQSISDSILMVTGKLWEKYTLSSDAGYMTLQPGIVGARINEILKPLGRRFSPDPASLKSAMVGGIIMNNASGMNCGTHANSDKVIRSVKMILTDGTRLDTADENSCQAFRSSHPEFIEDLIQIRADILADDELKNRILRKYSIKNVTGLNLLPLVVFDDPFEIMTHLLVGSEGTLAFLSEATMSTEIDLPFKASAMIYFDDIKTACKAVQTIKSGPVAGAEMLDRKALRSVENKTGIPSYIKDFGDGATAVLVETKANTAEKLQEQIQEIIRLLSEYKTLTPIHFTDIESEYSVLWAIRSGIFPSVGGMRKPGTTCLIEDVAFHLEDLPEATAELQDIIARHGYDDGVIYGHALEGNYHFIINQRFDSQTEVERYEALMNDVIALVVDKYDGSLKAEHGTGRNMAPFVAREWGEKAFGIMKRVKQLFDPQNILNPGVIFNDDPHCHIRDFKPLTLCNTHVDKCIECGFCEVNCLTSGFTLSSRQRIVLRREIARLENEGQDQALIREMEKAYRYLGNDTCAGDGLCATSCPMDINTGHLTHDLRQTDHPAGSLGWKTGQFAANHFSGIKSGLRSVLAIANGAHTLLGSPSMSAITRAIHIGSGRTIPLWTPAMPKSHKIKLDRIRQKTQPLKVVYFPSCINQAMGISKGAPDNTPLSDKMLQLLQKSGYEVIFPKGMESLCCGTIWESKGMPDIANRKTKELEDALWEASEKGLYPVLCDQSPCLYRMRSEIKRMKLYEPVEFIETYLVDRLDFHPMNESIAIHTTCSMTKMGLKNCLEKLANRCSTNILIPQEVGCCGFAGDKGFTHPEVNRYALRKLRPQLQSAAVKTGYSNSRTCEIGLTTNGGIPYMSIVYLVDQCTTAKYRD